MNQNLCIEKIRSAIEAGAHPPRPCKDSFQAASVMALFTFGQVLDLIFIQKADIKGYAWRNQMAFPGGHVDEKDGSSRETALRELHEEMGIAAKNVSVMGSLGHFQTINNKDIEAFIGVWNKKEKIRHDPSEISRVIPIPFAYLTRLHREKGYGGYRPEGLELTYPYEDVVIWGVTAKILHHLIEILIPSPAETITLQR